MVGGAFHEIARGEMAVFVFRLKSTGLKKSGLTSLNEQEMSSRQHMLLQRGVYQRGLLLTAPRFCE